MCDILAQAGGFPPKWLELLYWFCSFCHPVARQDFASPRQDTFIDLFMATTRKSVVEVVNGFEEVDFVNILEADMSAIARGLWQRSELHCSRAFRGVGSPGLPRPSRAPSTVLSPVGRPFVLRRGLFAGACAFGSTTPPLGGGHCGPSQPLRAIAATAGHSRCHCGPFPRPQEATAGHSRGNNE